MVVGVSEMKNEMDLRKYGNNVMMRYVQIDSIIMSMGG
jgi:hypothetical protein